MDAKRVLEDAGVHPVYLAGYEAGVTAERGRSETQEALEQAAALLERLIACGRGESEMSDDAVSVCVPSVLNMIYAALEKANRRT